MLPRPAQLEGSRGYRLALQAAPSVAACQHSMRRPFGIPHTRSCASGTVMSHSGQSSLPTFGPSCSTVARPTDTAGQETASVAKTGGDVSSAGTMGTLDIAPGDVVGANRVEADLRERRQREFIWGVRAQLVPGYIKLPESPSGSGTLLISNLRAL